MTKPYAVANNNPHFLTHTIVDWIDLFTRRELAYVIIDSLEYCISERGLVIYSWCLMPSHLHMIANCKEDNISLSDVMRDFKKYTAKKLIEEIKMINESRRKWLLERFRLPSGGYQVWQKGMHAIELFSNKFMDQKLNYIHKNPLEAGLVFEESGYAYSSAIDYQDGKGLLPIEFME